MKKYDLLSRLDVAFDRILAPKPLDEIVTEGIRVATEEIMQCDYTIKRQEFIKHMAKARQAAMVSWVKKENENGI